MKQKISFSESISLLVYLVQFSISHDSMHLHHTDLDFSLVPLYRHLKFLVNCPPFRRPPGLSYSACLVAVPFRQPNMPIPTRDVDGDDDDD
jgi:hypothetical protein